MSDRGKLTDKIDNAIAVMDDAGEVIEQQRERIALLEAALREAREINARGDWTLGLGQRIDSLLSSPGRAEGGGANPV